MKVLVLGGDGYLGWSTAIYLSNQGYDVVVVDNYLRRNLMRSTDNEPLFDVPNLHERVRMWKAVSGKDIDICVGDLCDWEFVQDVFKTHEPEAVVHFAEQPSAPYSMMNRDTAILTINNNLVGTANIIHAIKQFNPDCHLVKLGTMGEYGTPNIDIEEGWIEINHKNRSDKFLYPRQAGSLYHTTKIMDTDLLWFYVRTWGLKVTDLMQGPVYGIHIAENDEHEELLPFFSYDEVFGTVLNRFIVQAAAGYPLTVYGKGNQKRGYINIRDVVKCIELAIKAEPARGELMIHNQLTETFSVNDLAEKVRAVGKNYNINVEINKIENPRVELEDHYYNPNYSNLVALGLEPTLLTEEILNQLFDFVLKKKDKIRKSRIFSGISWR